MADSRIAIYVYKTTSITIDPQGQSIDWMSMNDDYTAKFQVTLTSTYTNDFSPGVYGFVYNGSHGVTTGGSTSIVTDAYDVQRKDPWPQPPPPPPPPYVNRNDWNDHATIFLVPLGATFELGADESKSGG